MNENTYTSQQAQKLRSQADLFSVSQIGQTIVVSSLKNQLWVEWQMDGTVEIGVGLNTKKKTVNYTTVSLSCQSHQATVSRGCVATSMGWNLTIGLAGQER